MGLEFVTRRSGSPTRTTTKEAPPVAAPREAAPSETTQEPDEPEAPAAEAPVEIPADPLRRNILETIWLPVGQVKLNPNNARTHTDEQIDNMCESLTEFGWTGPIKVDQEGMLVAGERRYLAAIKLGAHEVPTQCMSGLTPLQIKAYMLTDNESALHGGWGVEVLKAEMAELADAGFDLGLTGFPDKDIEHLLEEEEGLGIEEVDTSTVADEFWVIIRGPIEYQADVLLRMEEQCEDMPEVVVELGTVDMGL